MIFGLGVFFFVAKIACANDGFSYFNYSEK